MPNIFYSNSSTTQYLSCFCSLRLIQFKIKKMIQDFNIKNDQVLFFGDSLRSDIIPSKVHAGWDTVYILEEMASERCFHMPRPDNLKVEVYYFFLILRN